MRICSHVVRCGLSQFINPRGFRGAYVPGDALCEEPPGRDMPKAKDEVPAISDSATGTDDFVEDFTGMDDSSDETYDEIMEDLTGTDDFNAFTKGGRIHRHG